MSERRVRATRVGVRAAMVPLLVGLFLGALVGSFITRAASAAERPYVVVYAGRLDPVVLRLVPELIAFECVVRIDASPTPDPATFTAEDAVVRVTSATVTFWILDPRGGHAPEEGTVDIDDREPEGVELAISPPGEDGGTRVVDSRARMDGATTGNDVAPQPVPHRHRPAASNCAPTPLPAEPTSVPPALTSDAGGDPTLSRDCIIHADCTDAPNGRCVGVTDCNPSTATCGTHCVYEQCTKDDDCGAGSACFCSDDKTFCAGGYATSCSLLASGYVCACGVANQCKKGNCRVDSDCGQGGYCSPALDDCGTVLGYYCHTAEDECVNDEDCTNRDGGPPGGYLGCLPDPNSLSRWVCTPPASCP